jgi:hypothetical protein
MSVTKSYALIKWYRTRNPRVTDPDICRVGSPAPGGNKPARQATGNTVGKNRPRPSPDEWKLLALLVSAIEPVAKLIDALSRIRW